MRKTCLNCIYELAKADERVFFIGSDLGYGVLKEFRETIPERFFMEGISEACVVGMASGLAMEGKVVYVNTIATFLARRAFEQIVVDACLHDVPVRFVANGGGLVYAPLGSTHLAIEDLSALRCVPNLTILAPADAMEMAALMPLTLDWPHPIYIRLAKGYDPIVTPADARRAIGQAVVAASGGDVLFITAGVCLQRALEARELLGAKGLTAGVLHLPTIKPLDETAILDAVSAARVVITVEENTLQGGLGDAVAALLLESGLHQGRRFRRLGLPDLFPDAYGSQEELLRRYGLSADNLAAVAKELVVGKGAA
jgi:transketolase